jgi:hypothetical protein
MAIAVADMERQAARVFGNESRTIDRGFATDGIQHVPDR